MTNFGKSLSIGLVVIVIALVIWFVARKPADEIIPVVEQDQTTQSQQMNTTDDSNQSLDQDMTSIESQMNALNTDASAASSVE
jgi:predicted PurR-regulated permease PerM